MSTKSRDETEEWIMALQAILIQVGDSPELQTEKKRKDRAVKQTIRNIISTHTQLRRRENEKE